MKSNFEIQRFVIYTGQSQTMPADVFNSDKTRPDSKLDDSRQ